VARHYSREEVAALVDHTLLKPEATEVDVAMHVHEAAELDVYAVCVSPSMVSVAKSSRSLGQAIATVVGFPSGKHLSEIKAREATLATAAGAEEIDMVIDIGAALYGGFDAVQTDVAAVRAAIGEPVILKVIVESAALLSLSGEQTCGGGLPGRRRRWRGFCEDLHRFSPVRRRLGAGRRADGRGGGPTA
jgi:deoxyribose-phosphate aldolase